MSAAFFSLGNTARTQEDTKAALKFYQQAVGTAGSTPSNSLQITKIQAQLNQLSLLLETKQWQDAQALWPQIQSEIPKLPSSRTAVYAKINFAQSLALLRQATTADALSDLDIAQLLVAAVKQSKSLSDQRSISYALGSLGGLYEQTQQWSDAKDLTQQALLLTQAINAPDIAYRWQWQLGRLLKEQGDIPGAIAAYTEAVNTLQSLRGDLVAINPNVQFSFRESVEPVYRQLVGLLLESTDTKSVQKNLTQARNVFESLQQAELVNFFRETCIDTRPVQIDSIDQQAAVIYPVILPDRLEVILSLPNQKLRHYATPLPQEQVEGIAIQLRQLLFQRTNSQSLPLSQQVYNWLIRPAEADLTRSKVKTLVFVLDGALRNIPMATLHDGKQYLMEKYAIALTPGLALLESHPLARGRLKALTAGISKPHQGYPALTYVEPELKQILSRIPGKALLNQKFTDATLQQEISEEPFSIVHIASHGQFSSKSEETFILTWDDRIRVGELNNLLRTTDRRQSNPIELLVLSACETAKGDNRAALGLAGVAVRAGARSTLATLWSVEDEVTASFMSRFYQELANATVTKAEALRRAQTSILQNPKYKQRPYYWASYVLVGNWL
jgi:CHAT domain-containing protein